MIIRPLFLTFIFVVYLSFGLISQERKQSMPIDKVESALQIINYAYVEEVDQDELIEQSIISTLSKLDPFSQYISKEELKSSNEELIGNFEGIGISYQVYKDTVNIIAPVPGSPSEKSGIKGGDKIIRVDGNNFIGDHLTEEFITNVMRGKKGTKVDLTIVRGGKVKKELTYSVTRDFIPIKSVVAYYMVNDQIGYIKISRFARTTVGEFKIAIDELKSQGLVSLILDLRGNTGGYFDAAVNLTDEFLDYGKMIVYTQGAASPKRRYKSSYIGNFTVGSIAVLIDNSSASASEIVAGALQDWGRAVIIGRRSYGKGFVQRPYYLPDSSVIRLTIAKYYSPTGRCIQKPYQDGVPDYLKDIEDKLSRGEMVKNEALIFPDSLKFITNNGRMVFGGGGIMPDIYVTIDSLRLNPLYLKLIEKDIINDFVMEYMNGYRGKLHREYNSFEKFNLDFHPDNNMLNEFKSFSQQRNLYIDPFEFEPIKSIVVNDLKSLLARHLFGVSYYYQVMNNKDKDFYKAIEVLESNSILAELNID